MGSKILSIEKLEKIEKNKKERETLLVSGLSNFILFVFWDIVF